MFYTVYRVTNKIDGKFYIGAHKTEDIDDDYMGSGKYLKLAQKKHGLVNFEKELLFSYENPEEMFAKEAELVTKELVSRDDNYNLKEGGFGGWDYINKDTEKRRVKNQKARRIANQNGALEKAQVWRKTIRADYYKDPKHCSHCEKPLEFSQRRGKYCSRSCAASVNNTLYPKRNNSEVAQW